MAARRLFERKFGEEFVAGLPAAPGIYLFRDSRGRILYVGKAKDLRRRLASYRNATRRKVHRKMRVLVREASALEVRVLATEREALLAENALIRELRPPYNVEGAYTFLYPAIGVAEREGAGQVLFCFTTQIEAWEELGFAWYGSFRSRSRALEAFDALIDIVTRVGHREPRSRLPTLPRVRGSRLVGVRRLGADRVAEIRRYLGGSSRAALGRLALDLLEKPRARRDAADVQQALDRLAAFWSSDIEKLRRALARVGRPPSFVPPGERDALFIESRVDQPRGRLPA